MKIGVLAFQGDVIEHIRVLESLGAEASPVRSIKDLGGVDGLILPGGESTTIGKFLKETGLDQRIIERYRKEQFPIFGTCAGAILLAREVQGNSAQSLKLIDITLERNAYGSQSESFEAEVSLTFPKCHAEPCHPERSPKGGVEGRSMTTTIVSLFEPFDRTQDKLSQSDTFTASFIRAPKIVKVGEGVQILGSLNGEPVACLQRSLLVTTFHLELAAGSTLVHQYFLQLIGEQLDARKMASIGLKYPI